MDDYQTTFDTANSEILRLETEKADLEKDSSNTIDDKRTEEEGVVRYFCASDLYFVV